MALGAEVAGLFSNEDSLASDLYQAGLRAGDYNWRMPLVEKYFSSLSSPFADFKNSADGFGGAITAGLFLQKFVGDSVWARLDIYAWSDKVHGALARPVATVKECNALLNSSSIRLLCNNTDPIYFVDHRCSVGRLVRRRGVVISYSFPGACLFGH